MSEYLNFHLANQPKRVLYADDDHTIIEIAVNAARDMALHGYLTQSADIIAPIWNISKLGITRSFSHNFARNAISLVGIEMLWKEANFKPQNLMGWLPLLDELKYTSEQLEIEQREYFCQSVPGEDIARVPVIPDWAAMRKSLSVQVDPHTGIQKLPNEDMETTCLHLLERHIDSMSPPSEPRRIGSRLLALGLDLAIKWEDPTKIELLLQKIAARIAAMVPDATRELALAPRTGRIVRSMKTIREATGLTTNRAEVITAEIVANLRIRLRSGEPRPHSKLSWEILLSEIEEWESSMQDDEHEVELPFRRPPATQSQIETAEQQLGVQLPKDYKEFLAVSDGLGSFNISQTTPLLSVDEVFWETAHGHIRVEHRRFEVPNERLSTLPLLDRVLQVSEVDEDAAASWWLVEPSLVSAAKYHMCESSAAHWLGVNFAEWKPTFSNHGSFRVMMERRLSFLINMEKSYV